MAHAIVDIATVQAAMLVTDSTHTSALQLCIDGASDAIERWTRRRFLTASHAAWHDGSAAGEMGGVARNALYLAEPETCFATLPVSAVSSITEDGTSLNVILMHAATTFTNGEAAVVFTDRGIVRRAVVTGGEIAYTSWSSGSANIKTAYTAGYALASMPQALQLVCIDLTQRIYRESFRLGVASQNDMGASVSYERLLPPWAKDMLSSFKFVGSPRTLAG